MSGRIHTCRFRFIPAVSRLQIAKGAVLKGLYYKLQNVCVFSAISTSSALLAGSMAIKHTCTSQLKPSSTLITPRWWLFLALLLFCAVPSAKRHWADAAGNTARAFPSFALLPTNQPINQPTNQPTNKTNQQTNKPRGLLPFVHISLMCM